MNLPAFLMVFTVAGVGLLAGLLGWNMLADLRSQGQLHTLQLHGEKLDESGEKAKAETDARIDSMARSGESLKDMGANEIVRAMRRKIRRAAEGKDLDPNDFGLDEYRNVVKLLRDTVVEEGLEDSKFPLRAYVEADRRSKNAIRDVMITLRSLREVEQAEIEK